MTKNNSITIKMKCGCGNLFCTVVEKDGKPWNVITRLGKGGGCPSCFTEALGRVLTENFRNGGIPKKIIKELKGIQCGRPIKFGEDQCLSCPDAIGKALEIYFGEYIGRKPKGVEKVEQKKQAKKEEQKEKEERKEEEEMVRAGICPDCQAELVMQEGCMKCMSCGYSVC